LLTASYCPKTVRILAVCVANEKPIYDSFQSLGLAG
jgi:hypothetical protein